MKTATAQPANGEIVETKTTRRVVPVNEASERSTPEFWEYLRSLDSKPGEWDRHIIYVYRVEPGGPGGSGVPVGKFSSVMTFPDGTNVAMSNQEEIEFGIARNFGGRTYRLIVKRGSERITQERVYIDAPPRPVVPAAEAVQNSNMPGIPSDNGNGIAAIAGKAIDTVAGQEAAQTRITIDALSAAANIVRTMGQGSQPDEVTRQFMAVAMQRMLQPPPDPFEQFGKFLAMWQSLQGGGNPMVGQIMDVAFKRLLEPPTSGAPAVSAGAELVRSLPAVGSQIVEGLREWRMGMEAQERGVTVMRATGAPPMPSAAAPPAQVLPPPPTANPAPNGAPTMGAPSLEFIEQRIVEMLRAPVSAEEAADNALQFLHTLDGDNPQPGKSYVLQLASAGETGLLQLFNMRPILKQATTNTQRLLEFIREFLKLHAEDEKAQAEEANERKPN